MKFNTSHSKIQSNTRGFSTIEILIAFAVGIIFLSAAMMVAFSDPSLTEQVSFDNGQAASLDTVLDNYGLSTSTNRIGSIVASLTKNWSTVLTSNFEIINAKLIYANTPKIVDISPCMKIVTNDTSWTAPNNRPRNIFFGTGLSNINVAQAFGPGGCDPTPPLDAWDSPQTYGDATTLNDVYTNDLAILKNEGKRIVILGTIPTTTGATAEALPDIYSFDLTDPAHPSSVLGELNTGKGLNAIASDGEYAFGAHNASTDQLQIIRLFDTGESITDPAYYEPELVSESSLSGVSGSYPEGRAIAYYNDTVYIGTWNNNFAGSPEFLIYDVSNRSNPIFRGKIDVGHSVNAIGIQWPYAYLATTNNTGEMMVVNIADATNPQIISSFNIDTSNVNVDAEEIAVLGNRVYVGMDRNTGVRGELIIVNITNPASPLLYKNLDLGLVGTTQVTGIAVQGEYLFIGTDQTDKKFQVYNVKNPANPILMSCSPHNSGEKPSALKYSQGYVFVSSYTDTALEIIYDTSGNSCN